MEATNGTPNTLNGAIENALAQITNKKNGDTSTEILHAHVVDFFRQMLTRFTLNPDINPNATASALIFFHLISQEKLNLSQGSVHSALRSLMPALLTAEELKHAEEA